MTRTPPRRVTLAATAAALATGCGHRASPVDPIEQLVQQLNQAIQQGDAQTLAGMLETASGSATDRYCALTRQQAGLCDRHRLELLRQEDFGGFVVATVSASIADRSPDLTYLACRKGTNGLSVVLWTDVDPEFAQRTPTRRTGVVSCKACNYEVGDSSLDNWLVVPLPRGSAAGIEQIEFHELSQSAKLTFSVHARATEQSATAILEQLRSEGQSELHWETAGTVESWLPPRYCDQPVEGLSGARCEFGLGNGRTKILHTVVFVPPGSSGSAESLCYLLSFEGPKAALASDLETWLRSLRFVDPRCPAATVGQAAVQAHSGGSVHDDGSYVNAKYRLRSVGPADWQLSAQADGCLFGATWTCPVDRGIARLRGYARVPGAGALERAWSMTCKDLAARQIDFTASDWRQVDGAWHRSIVGTPIATGSRSGRHLIELRVFDDLWLWVEGEIHDEAATPAFARLVKSIERS